MHQLMSEFKVSSRLGSGFSSSFSAPTPTYQSTPVSSSWEPDSSDYSSGASDNPFTGAKY